MASVSIWQASPTGHRAFASVTGVQAAPEATSSVATHAPFEQKSAAVASQTLSGQGSPSFEGGFWQTCPMQSNPGRQSAAAAQLAPLSLRLAHFPC